MLTSEQGGKSYSGKAEEDGSFKIAGVSSGKYSVGATRYPLAGDGGKGAPPTEANKKLDEKWDVSSSNKSFTLDVAKLKDAMKVGR